MVEGCLRKNPEERFTLDDLIANSAFDFCRQRYAGLLEFLNDKNAEKIQGFCLEYINNSFGNKNYFCSVLTKSLLSYFQVSKVYWESSVILKSFISQEFSLYNKSKW